MLCENCKKNVANTYFKQTVNGKTSEVFLCSECASKLGVNQTVTSNMAFGFGDLLNEFFSPYYQTKPLSEGTKKIERLTCPYCNMTEEEFFRTGKAGCGNHAAGGRRKARRCGRDRDRGRGIIPRH